MAETPTLDERLAHLSAQDVATLTDEERAELEELLAKAETGKSADIMLGPTDVSGK